MMGTVHYAIYEAEDIQTFKCLYKAKLVLYSPSKRTRNLLEINIFVFEILKPVQIRMAWPVSMPTLAVV